MYLEGMAGADHTALGEVDPTDPAEVVTDQVEAATDLAMEGEVYQWAPWQLERALA